MVLVCACAASTVHPHVGAVDPSKMMWAMVRHMHAACARLTPAPAEITFPVKASLVASTLEQLVWLATQSDRYSLTLWHGDDDTADDEYVRALVHLRDALPPGRLLYDGPVNHLLERYSLL